MMKALKNFMSKPITYAPHVRALAWHVADGRITR